MTKCFVATDYSKRLAKRMGLRESQIVVHGLPIRPIFSKPLPAKPALRRALGLEPDTPAVLLVGGGEGMGALEATVDELAARLGGRCQVAVICGRNAKLLASLTARGRPNGMKLVPCGFVDNIHEWMAASDVIITKAGPGTIAEALISGLPVLLNGNIPCQEEGNIPYVLDNKARGVVGLIPPSAAPPSLSRARAPGRGEGSAGLARPRPAAPSDAARRRPALAPPSLSRDHPQVGAFETKPARIAAILQRWLSEGRGELAAMAARSRALGKPQAVYNIARDLVALTDGKQPVAVPA